MELYLWEELKKEILKFQNRNGLKAIPYTLKKIYPKSIVIETSELLEHYK